MEEEYIGYKIDTKHSYKVYVSESNGKKFYKVQIKKKNIDDTETNFYKQLRFAKCDPPVNGEIIRIKKGFEDLYFNSVDKYNPISVIVVLDYERPALRSEKKQEAIDQFFNNIEQIDNTTTVVDDDLPF